MTYPFMLTGLEIFPIFGKNLVGPGLSISFDDRDMTNQYTFMDQSVLQKEVDDLLKNSDNDWAYGSYLEKREGLFRALDAKQMVEQERFFHLGVDLTRPVGSAVYAPLGGEVVLSGYEEGVGNYGGFIVLKHCVSREIFYSLYGHLNVSTITEKKSINSGDYIGSLGDISQNGGYWSHLHLQVFTKLGYEKGFVSKGYCREDQLADIRLYCPDPTFLFAIPAVEL